MMAIRPAQIQDWVKNAAENGNAAPVVLDVREPWELQTASVKADGFELVAMPMRSVPARYMELQRDQPIACLCHHGGRSAQVAHFLMQNGFTQIVNVQGGINAWSNEVDPSIPTY
jgi:rhodanese-related sulfurtransferase